MKITLLCSDPSHPVIDYLKIWMQGQVKTHFVELVNKTTQLNGGDILFLVSCTEIIKANDRAKYQATLVLHASDLPAGRGWSPHIWEIVQGADHITLSLLEAEDKVDSGKVWHKKQIYVPKHVLWDEINHLLFTAEVEMIDYALKNFGRCTPQIQLGLQNLTYYPKRTRSDSQIDPQKSIAEQFDMIRICDPNRFPAYFEYLGKRYTLKLEKLDE